MNLDPIARSIRRRLAPNRRNAFEVLTFAAVPTIFAVWFHVLALTPGGFLAGGLAPLIGSAQDMVVVAGARAAPPHARVAPPGAAPGSPQTPLAPVALVLPSPTRVALLPQQPDSSAGRTKASGAGIGLGVGVTGLPPRGNAPSAGGLGTSRGSGAVNTAGASASGRTTVRPGGGANVRGKLPVGSATSSGGTSGNVAATLPYRLTVGKVGAAGTITSSPGAISCGTTCQDDLPPATAVTLTATTAVTWSGDTGGGCLGTSTTCTVTMNQSRTITATFDDVTARCAGIANCDFETTPTTCWAPNGPTTSSFTIATDRSSHPPTGHAAKIQSSQPYGSLSRWLSQLPCTPVKPGAAYDVSVWLSTSGVQQNAVLAVTFFDSTGTYIAGSASSSSPLSGTTPGTALELFPSQPLHVVAPATATNMRIELRLYGPGTIWFDDVSVSG